MSRSMSMLYELLLLPSIGLDHLLDLITVPEISWNGFVFGPDLESKKF